MTTTRSEQDWLDAIRASILRGETTSAQTALDQALAEHPASAELLRAQAGVFQQTGQGEAAEQTLRALLAADPADTASAFALARLLKKQARFAAAAAILRACFAAPANARNADLAITAIELLDDFYRAQDAAAIAEGAVAANPADARLHAYAGMLAMKLGQFERARERYLFALGHDPRAVEWHAPIGLADAQRYVDPAHPDLALFRGALERHDLSPLARAEIHFALGKASDDLGDCGAAAPDYRQGNAIRKRDSPWSRKAWRRAIEARLAARPVTVPTAPTEGFTPVFIVGMPRTGTTLLAGLLARHPQTCNRGELPTLALLAAQPALNGSPDRGALQHAAADYARDSRQDDAPDARWFIDKQPLNFRYVDLALALFPGARIVHCQRSPRDTALSLWQQCFLEDVQGYAYDFADIACIMRDEKKLMDHWRTRWPDSIRAVAYEQLVTAPRDTVAELAAWIGLPPQPPGEDQDHAPAQTSSAINTASLWQARQPINTRSIGRWKAYAPYLPELLRIAETS
ncbi:MAG: tetratricopeptide repeat-containing sulfotransferase family protein [Rhodanobacteraceae bacterium]